MFKEPIVKIVDASKTGLIRFLYGFSAVVLLSFGIIITLSIYSNHWGYFGEKGQYWAYNDRIAKAEFLKGLDRDNMPQAFILGSSAMLPFQPSKIKELFGYETFNLANFWGRIEEIWGWTNYLVHDLKSPPKLILIGLEPWTFSVDDSGIPLLSEYRRRFVVTEDIVKYAPNYSRWRYEMGRILDSVSEQNLYVLIQTTRKHKFKRFSLEPLLRSPFLLDGTASNYNKLNPKPFLPDEVNDFYLKIFTGDLINQNEIERERSALLRKRFIRLQDIVVRLPGDRMNIEEFDLFEKTIDLCHKNQIQVGVILPPMHPYFSDLLKQDTRYQEHLQKINSMVINLQAKYDNIHGFFDASDINSFKGDPRAFHDRIHMTPINANLITEELKKGWRTQ